MPYWVLLCKSKWNPHVFEKQKKKNLFSEGCVLQMAKTTLRGSLKYEELHESVEFLGGQYWYKLF